MICGCNPITPDELEALVTRLHDMAYLPPGSSVDAVVPPSPASATSDKVGKPETTLVRKQRWIEAAEVVISVFRICRQIIVNFLHTV